MTDSELAVARLVAQGFTNREVPTPCLHQARRQLPGRADPARGHPRLAPLRAEGTQPMSGRVSNARHMAPVSTVDMTRPCGARGRDHQRHWVQARRPAYDREGAPNEPHA